MPPKTVKVEPPTDIVTYSETILKGVSQKILQQLMQGKLIIRETPMHISFNTQLQQKKYASENIRSKEQRQEGHHNLQDKIGALHQDLEDLHNFISEKRKKDREEEEAKRKEAVAIISRLKKKKRSKSEYLKLNDSLIKESERKLDQMIIQHREFQANRARERKRQISSKIQENISRRYQREKTMLDNQIQYWSKVQDFEKQKRHNSVSSLPPISQRKDKNANNDPFGLGSGVTIPRKNSDALLKKKGAEQKMEYQDIVHKFLQRAKIMQQKSRIKEAKQSRISIENVVPQSYENPLLNPEYKYSHLINRNHILGNEYMKQSVAIAIKHEKKPTLQEQNQNQKMFFVAPEKMPFSKNNVVVGLEEKRERILTNLIDHKISKQQANEKIRKIDRHLDKMDSQGIQNRMRQKLESFQKADKDKHFFISQP